MTEKMRRDFEAECHRYWGERCPDLTFVDDKYDQNGRADLAWRFWQAATAKAQPVQSPQRQPLTLEQIKSMDCRVEFDEHLRVVRMTEAVHGIGA